LDLLQGNRQGLLRVGLSPRDWLPWAVVCGQSRQQRRRGRVSYYDGDAWSNHVANLIECGECEQEYDEQEGEGNICPTCKEKEGE
jgi:hypothetical protein